MQLFVGSSWSSVAVKYSLEEDKVTIHATMENDTIQVSVHDDGIGINAKSLNKIFELYYREDGRAAHFQGMGIGLAISKDIIRRHRGRIWAESEPGKGSNFYFTLPLRLQNVF